MDVKESVAIVGSGLIGRSWAIVFAGGGCEVALYDAVAGRRRAGARAGGRRPCRACGARPGRGRERGQARVRAAASLADALAGATFVQENTPETLEAKREIFAELDRLSAPDAILASSTSTIVASSFTESSPGRTVAWSPIRSTRRIWCRWSSWWARPGPRPRSSPRPRRSIEAVGQVPIVVKREIEGFILNRLQAVLLSEAFRLVGRAMCRRRTSTRRSRTASACAGRSWGRSRPSSSTRRAASRIIAAATAPSLGAAERRRTRHLSHPEHRADPDTVGRTGADPTRLPRACAGATGGSPPSRRTSVRNLPVDAAR